MLYPYPIPLLFCAAAFSICPANAETPESIKDLETAYHKFCTKRGAALLPAFSKKLLALQQQAVSRSDFEKAKQIQAVLTDIKQDIMSPPSPAVIDPFFTGKVWGLPNNKKHYVGSSLRLFKKDLKQTEFQPQNEWVDTGKSSREIITFTSPPGRVWLKKDDSTTIQIYSDLYVDWFTVQGHEQKMPPSAAEDLNALQQEFREEYAKACKPLTRKYLDAVNKRQKQLVQEGNMEGAISIHEYMKKLGSGNRPPDQMLTGIWKSKNGDLYDFSNKSRAAVKKPDGSLNFYLEYTFSSPRGEWKIGRSDRGSGKGKEFIIFPSGESIYIILNKPDSFLCVLTRVSGK